MRYPRAWFALVANWVLPTSSFSNLPGPRTFRSGHYQERAPQSLGRCNSPAPHANNSFTTKSPNVWFVIGESHPETDSLFFSSFIEPWKVSRGQDMKRRVGARSKK
ncbi:hypothetical protein QBC45DRAFT_419846 [Copromyces sp. CBS 386.78]|nr:hypothetical protein QBC45DRAFT_419846 [Copromyces sp. CBS 386.78]